MSQDTPTESQYTPTAFREVTTEFYFIFMLPVAVAGMGQQTGWMTLFVLANLCFRFVLCYKPKDEWFFLLGLLAGGGNDLISMIRGVYSYTPPHMLPWPIPIWMLIFWGQVFLMFRRVLDYGPFRGEGIPRSSVFTPDRRLVLDIAIMLLFKASVYNYAAEPFLPSILGFALLVLRFTIHRPTSVELNILAVTLLIGPAYEILLVRLGLYNYQHGYFFGLPIWLLVFWAIAILISKNVFDRFEAFFGRPNRPFLVPRPE